jgi:GrpB-like predicted nucleotidyltransferase (UPF0157 family)/RimJ/RimL family protein N-acetyltransferase/SAM-dependent methyltransferase
MMTYAVSLSDVPARAASFAKLLAAEFGGRLQCIVLAGSHARDEARPESDIDVWVFLDEVRASDLAAVGGIVEALGPGPEINPQCVSFAEVRSGAFREQLSSVQLHLDGVILHGRLDLPKPGPTEVRRLAGVLAVSVMMGARHYLAVRESEESLAQGRLEKWVLKPLMWALRYEAFARTGCYPRSLAELAECACSPEAVRLIEIHRQLHERTFAGPWMPVVEQAESVAREVMGVQRVVLVPHDPRWAGEFEREAASVSAALGSVLTAIHHIGSTAIPGIRAKPIIDMLAVVDDLALLDERSAGLEAVGYEALGEFGIAGRRYFRKDNASGERTHQVHAFQAGSPQIARHLAFRDFLRAHPGDASAYDALKQRLAEAHPGDIAGYTDGKDAFIRDVDSRAEAFYEAMGFELEPGKSREIEHEGIRLPELRYRKRLVPDDRYEAAEYYDKFAGPPPGDVEFYRARVRPEMRVLELGCGTGRVLAPLAAAGGFVFGLDGSPVMLEVCRRNLAAAGLGADRAVVEIGDICDFDLTGRMPKFDLIIAPFRVMQNLETDEQVGGFLRCIRRHLAPGGEVVLNTFRPRGGPEEIKALWDARDGSTPAWTKPDGEETVTLTEDCTRHSDSPLTVYPRLTYRRFDREGALIDEAALDIAMRVWYLDALLDLIASHGFAVTGRFGGYQGEPWLEGSELVVTFGRPEAFAIRPYRADDAEGIYAAVDESRGPLGKWMRWMTPSYSLEDARAWVGHAIQARESGESYEFVIVDARDGGIVGSCGLNALNRSEQFCNLGYWVRASRRGQGAARQAVLALREFGFNELKLNRLEIVIADGNEASRRVAERAGAIYEGLLKKRLMVGDAAHDAHMYAFLNES